VKVIHKHKAYSFEEFLTQAQKSLIDDSIASWEKDIFSFIVEWFNNEDHFNAFTSGSTGTPKKIEIKKRYAEASARKTADYFSLKPKMTALLCLPVSFIAGKMMLVRSYISGLNLILVKPSSSPLRDLNTAIDFIAMTPHQLSNTLKDCPEKLDLTRTILLGGGPVSETLKNDITKLNSKVYLGYGMTETITHIALRDLEEKNDDFHAIEGVSFNTDSESRLIISAQHLGIDELETNDIVSLKNDSSFSWLGRYDRVINSGGVKISPERLEATLSKTITEPFFLYGLPDETLGEKLVLIIETDTADYSLEHIKKVHKLIKDIVYLKSFTMTHSDKIDRLKTIENLIQIRKKNRTKF